MSEPLTLSLAPLERLRQHWQRQTPPALANFVAEFSDLSLAELVDLVRFDQQMRWRSGDHLPAEQYLMAFPQLRASEEDALVVICGEYELARELGAMPEPAEYRRRFPDWAERLAMQLVLCDALGESAPTLVGAIPGGQPTPSGPPGYDLKEELGRGGMGVVYRAWQHRLGRFVALKMLLAAGHAGGARLARFRLEAEAVARLRHPNIVEVYDYGSHDGLPYLVVELLEGGTLAAYLEKPGTLAPRQAAALLQNLAAAVHHAHQRGVIHRDLKPANILLAGRGEGGREGEAPAEPGVGGSAGASPSRPKIADFGLAKLTGMDVSETGAILGTPEYMAPEQAAGDPGQVTAAVDVYSLGAILYRCLTGRPPFVGRSPLQVLEQVRRDDPTPPRLLKKDLPRDLEMICLKCLRKEPAQRYESAAALAADLRAFQEGRPVRARPVGPAVRLLKWSRRHPTAVTLVACLLLAAVGFGALVGLQQHKLRKTRAVALVEALANAEPAVVTGLVDDIQDVRLLAEPLLRQQVQDSLASSRKHLNARLALLPSDPEQVAPLLARLPTAGPEETALLRRALQPHRERAVPLLQELGCKDLRAACLLALYSPEEDWPEAAPQLADQLLREPRLTVGQWSEMLRPIAAHLTPALADRFHQKPSSAAERALLAELLADYARDDIERLVDLFAVADDECAGPLLDRLKKRPDAARTLESTLPCSFGPLARAEDARQRARIAAELLRLDHADRVWPLLRHQSDPGLRSELIHRLARAQVPTGPLIKRLWDKQDVSEMRALVLALGEFPPAAVSKTDRDLLDKWLVQNYQRHPDAGLHAAIRWLVRAGWHDERLGWHLKRIEEDQAGRPGPPERQWTVNAEKQTLTLVRGPIDFEMGAPEGEGSERFHGAAETQHKVRLEGSFAIGSQKVTLGQFRRFCADHLHPVEYGNDKDGPVLAVSWYQAAEYCNWLSQREGLQREQWCYLPDEQGNYGPGMRIAPDALRRTGYRLPTEAEWEYACRAGAVTSRYYGSAEHLLRYYAWYRHSSNAYTPGSAQLKPNDLGLFDILGTAWEWCHEPLKNEEAAPIGSKTISLCRGGSYIDLPELVRAAYRCAYSPDGKDCTLGFRIARTLRD